MLAKLKYLFKGLLIFLLIKNRGYLFFILVFASCNEVIPTHRSCDNLLLKIKNNLAKASSHEDTLSVINLVKNYNENSCVEVSLLIADIYYDIDDYERSKLNYMNVLKKDKKNMYALFNLSLIFLNQEKYDSAITLLNIASSLKTVNGFVIDYNDSLASSPSNDVSFSKISYYLGLSYYYARNYQLAIEQFNYCITHNFNLEESYIYRGAIFCENDKVIMGCIDFKMAKKLGSVKVDKYLQKYCK